MVKANAAKHVEQRKYVGIDISKASAAKHALSKIDVKKNQRAGVNDCRARASKTICTGYLSQKQMQQSILMKENMLAYLSQIAGQRDSGNAEKSLQSTSPKFKH